MKSPAIYVRDERFEIGQAKAAVEAAAARLPLEGNDATRDRSLVVYVHGRALGGLSIVPMQDKEPEKSQRDVIPELEERYGSSVLMLHWPHKGYFWNFPDEDARAAAASLGALVEAVLDWKQAEPAPTRPPVVLLTHSMGSIVLEQLVLADGLNRLGEFDSILISSPANEASASPAWLGRLPVGRAYVTVNPKDPVLRDAMLGRASADALRGLVARNVVYVDTTGQDVRHRYFVFGKTMDPGEAILYEHFYRPVFAGTALEEERFVRLSPADPILALR